MHLLFVLVAGVGTVRNVSDEPNPAAAPKPLSAERLRSAFARMLGEPAAEAEAPVPTRTDAPTPDSLVEALLFVGRPDGTPISAETLAEAIRDVTPAEVAEIIERLDSAFQRDGAALRVERSEAGYRLGLAEGLDRVADRLQGKVRAARLSPQALETLSVVAYRQPVNAEVIDDLRGTSSAASLTQLVRLGLLSVENPDSSPKTPHYATTDRFLRTLELATLDQLPRVAELDD